MIGAIIAACIGLYYRFTRRGSGDLREDADEAEPGGLPQWLQWFLQRARTHLTAAGDDVGPQQPDPPPEYHQALAEGHHEPANQQEGVEELVEIAGRGGYHDHQQRRGPRMRHVRREQYVGTEPDMNREQDVPAEDRDVDHGVPPELPVDRNMAAELYPEQPFDAHLRHMDRLERAGLPVHRREAAELGQADNVGAGRYARAPSGTFEVGGPPSTREDLSVQRTYRHIQAESPPPLMRDRRLLRRQSPTITSIAVSHNSSETSSGGGMPLPRTPIRAVVREFSDQTWDRHGSSQLPVATSSARRSSY